MSGQIESGSPYLAAIATTEIKNRPSDWRMQLVIYSIFALNADRTDSLYPDFESRVRFAFADTSQGQGKRPDTHDVLFLNFRRDLVDHLEFPPNHPSRLRDEGHIRRVFEEFGIFRELQVEDLIRLAENVDGFSFKDILKEHE